MTAINIGDMYKVVEEHGLIPVPVDIDPYTMAPKLESIKAAVTDKTRVILFAFLFGITYDVAPYADFLDSQGIEIIEDCAQSWRGLDVFRGSPRAKMTMFSFGSIKFNAAFYGAISIVRNEAQLVDKMRSIQDTYEALSTDEYSKKIRTFLVL
jgi:perosamine synthetase